MSNFTIKAKHKDTGEVHEISCLDNYFGRRAYGYSCPRFTNRIILTEEQFYIEYEVAMTEKESKALKYLSNKMEATSKMVGDAITVGDAIGVRPLNPANCGARILGNLYKKDLVMRLPDLNAWRLTREGREYLARLGKNDA